MNFSNLKELKDRITPALELKADELGIDKEQIWDDLKYIWAEKEGLTLSEMVNDILNYKAR